MGVMIVPLFRARGLVPNASPRLPLVTCSVKNLVMSMSVLRRKPHQSGDGLPVGLIVFESTPGGEPHSCDAGA